MLWNVPEIWKGERVFIIGGGPSLSLLDLSKIYQERVIGVNHAYSLGQWVDICFYGDKAWYELNIHKIAEYGGMIVTCAVPPPEEKDLDRVLWLGRSRKGFETRRKNYIAWNSNSGYAAINLAYHLGASQAILLAFDMKSNDNGETHWHDLYKSKIYSRRKNDYSPYEKFLSYQKSLANGAKEAGFDIIDATINGDLTVFPKVDYESLFNQKEAK